MKINPRSTGYCDKACAAPVSSTLEVPSILVFKLLVFLFAACWFCQSGGARVASAAASGFYVPGPSRCLVWSTGNSAKNETFGVWASGCRQFLVAPVAASCRSLTLPLSRQIFLTLRSTPDAMKQPLFSSTFGAWRRLASRYV